MISEKKYLPIALKDAIKIEKLYSLHYFSYSKSFRFEGEAHDFWELVYCDSGEAQIVDEDKSFELSEGMAFLHAPNHFHTVRPNDKFTNVVIVSFEGKLNSILECSRKVLHLNKHEKEHLKTIIFEGREAFVEPLNLVYQYKLSLGNDLAFGTLQIIKNCLESLLISICRKQRLRLKPQKNDMLLSDSHEIALGIVSILNKKIKESVTLKEIAQEMNYSEAHIKQVFKDTMGLGIKKYFNNLKIERAKQLLSERVYSVSQIAEQLGFDSIQYFCRLFKNSTTLTPTAYQRSITMGIL